MSDDQKTIAIVGAGIVGVSTAIWLQRDGHKVVLIDKSAGPTEAASYGNAGLLASCAIVPVTVPGVVRQAPGMLMNPDKPLFMKWRYLPRLMPWLRRYLSHATAPEAARIAAAQTGLIGDSLADHQALAQGTGAEKWIVPSDYLFLYKSRAGFEHDAFGWNLRRANGFAWDELEGQAVQDYDPMYTDAHGFAVRLGNHGRIADPGCYVADLLDHFTGQGGRLIRAEAEDVVREAGQVTGLRVAGETIDCGAVIIAAGAWSQPLTRKLGLDIPLETERGYHLELWGPSAMPRAPAMITTGKFVMTPMQGRLRLAGIVEFGGLTAPPSRAPFELLRRQLKRVLPDLRWEKETEWMGHRPATTDSLPVIGEVPGVNGAWLGFGHQHVGLTAGPKTGQLLAQMIAGRVPNIDLAPFDPARF